MADWLTRERIGETRFRTPNGYLLLVGTPLARTGEYLYGPGETSLDPGAEPYVIVNRSEAEVFSDICMSSFNGTPFTNEHPPTDITLENDKQYAKGRVYNVRRGSGEYINHMIGDILVTDKETIRDIDGGKVEISCGYGADYVQTGYARGDQVNIVGNHVALVRQGRCGSTCSIGDRLYEGIEDMRVTDEGGKSPMIFRLFHALTKAKTVGDKAEIEKAQAAFDKAMKDEAEKSEKKDDETNDENMESNSDPVKDAALKTLTKSVADLTTVIQGFTTRMDAMDTKFTASIEGLKKTIDESAAEAEAEGEETNDEEMEESEATQDSARDSAGLKATFDDTVALGEILLPGIKLPTFDAKAPAKATYDTICKFRRAVVDKLWAGAEGKAFIQSFARVTDIAKIKSCDSIRNIFTTAGHLKKQANQFAASHSNTRDTQNPPANGRPLGTTVTNAEHNKNMDEYWKKRGVGA